METYVNQLSEDALPILEVIEDGVFIFRLDTLRFCFVNRGAARQTGYSLEELLSMTPLNLKREFTEDSFRVMLAPLIDGTVRTLRLVTTHHTKNNEEIAVEVILQLLAPVQTQARVVVIARDITERKRAGGLSDLPGAG